MKKSYVAILISMVIISCSKSNPNNDFPDSDQEDVINLAPNDFDIEVVNITDNSATINWDEAIDQENDSVLYSIYLNQSLIINGISELTYQFNDLSELTNYSGKVVAKDTNNNETEVTFSFQTEKYYLKYLKTYDYGQINDGTNRRVYGTPCSLLKTSDQNYIVIGTSSDPGGNGSRFFVQKIDYEGNEIWKKFYDYQVGDTWNFKSTLNSTGILIAARQHVLNLDLDGNLIWYKKIDSYDNGFGNSEIKSVKQDSKGYIYLVGGRGISDSEVHEEAVLTKLDNLGNIIWEKTYRSKPRNLFEDLVINSAGKLIIVGSTVPMDSEDLFGYWVLQLNNEGDIIWEKSFGFGYHGIPHHVIIKSNGNYAFVGYKNVFEVTPDGSEIKNHPIELSSPFSISETLDNGFIITGFSDFGYYGGLGIIKLDPYGNEEWSQLFQEPFTYLYGRCVLTEDDGGYRIAGSSSKNFYYDEDRPKLLMYKTDPAGNYE